MFEFIKESLIKRRNKVIEDLLISLIKNDIKEYSCKNIYWESFVGYCCTKDNQDPKSKYGKDYMSTSFNYLGINYNASFLYTRFPKDMKEVTIYIETEEEYNYRWKNNLRIY